MVPTIRGASAAQPALERFPQSGRFIAANFNNEDQVMPILIWIATVACMWEIAGAGIQLRPADEPRASEDEPRLVRPARRPPAIS
jgi:hypothetical protein